MTGCRECNGAGQVADYVMGTSIGLLLFGGYIHHPMMCPRCDGSGKEPERARAQHLP